jgi:hypothetical protein
MNQTKPDAPSRLPLAGQGDNSKRRKLRNLSLAGLFLMLLITIAGFFIFLGNIGWPGLHWDAALYGPPVLNVANGKGWIFGGYGPQITKRASLIYNFHGLLHVYFYGAVLRAGTWARYIYAQGIINSITFVFYSIIFLYILVSSHGIRFYSVLLSLSLGTVAGVICIGMQGRPEQLAPLILCLPLVSILFIKNRFYLAVMLGLTIGILVIVSPLVGLFFAGIALFYLLGTSGPSSLAFLKTAFITLCSALLVSAGLVPIISPFSTLQWYGQVMGAGQTKINFMWLLSGIHKYIFGFTFIAPAWNTVVIILILAGSLWLWRSKRSWTPLLFVFIAMIYFIPKMGDYSYAPFIPLGMALLLRQSGSSGCSILFSHWLPKLILTAFSSSYVLILLSYLAISIYVPRFQLSPLLSRQAFTNTTTGKELRSGLSAVGFTSITWPSMVLLGDASPYFASFNPSLNSTSDQSIEEYENKTKTKVLWFVYPQTMTKFNAVPPVNIFVGKNRYTLTKDMWIDPTFVDSILIPKHITNRNNFAIYRRVD